MAKYLFHSVHSVQSEKDPIFGSGSLHSNDTPTGLVVVEGVDEEVREIDVCNISSTDDTMLEEFWNEYFDPESPRFSVHFTTDRQKYQNSDVVLIRLNILNYQDHLPIHVSFESPSEILQHFGEFFFVVFDEDKRRIIDPVNLGCPECSVLSFRWNIPENIEPGKYHLTVYTESGKKVACPETSAIIEVESENSHEKISIENDFRLEFTNLEYSIDDEVTCILTTPEGFKDGNAEIHIEMDSKIVEKMKLSIYQKKKNLYQFNFDIPSVFVRGIGRVLLVTFPGKGDIKKRVLNKIPLTLKPFHLEIYPESGRIIGDIRNGIYLQARGLDNKPCGFVAEIREHTTLKVHDSVRKMHKALEEDETDEETLEFYRRRSTVGPGRFIKMVMAQHEGRTVFHFTPIYGKEYNLIIKKPKNILQSVFPLGKVEKEGVGLNLVKKSIHRVTDQITLHVNTPDYVRDVRIGLFKKEKMISFQRFRIIGGKISNVVHLHTGGVDGLLRITVFDASNKEEQYKSKEEVTQQSKVISGNWEQVEKEQYKVLAERLVFVKPVDDICVAIETKNLVILSGDKVKMSIAPTYRIQQVRGVKNTGICVKVVEEEQYKKIKRRERAPNLYASYFLQNQILSNYPSLESDRCFFDCASYFSDFIEDDDDDDDDDDDEDEDADADADDMEVETFMDTFDLLNQDMTHGKKMDLLLGCQSRRRYMMTDIHKTLKEASESEEEGNIRRLFCINKNKVKRVSEKVNLFWNNNNSNEEEEEVEGEGEDNIGKKKKKTKKTKKKGKKKKGEKEEESQVSLLKVFTPDKELENPPVLFFNSCAYIKSKKHPVANIEFSVPKTMKSRKYRVLVDVFTDIGYIGSSSSHIFIVEPIVKISAKNIPRNVCPPCQFLFPVEFTNLSSKNVPIVYSVVPENKNLQKSLMSSKDSGRIISVATVPEETKVRNSPSSPKRKLKKNIKEESMIRMEFHQLFSIPNPWKFVLETKSKSMTIQSIPFEVSAHPSGFPASQSFLLFYSENTNRGSHKFSFNMPPNETVIPFSTKFSLRISQDFPSLVFFFFEQFKDFYSLIDSNTVFHYVFGLYPSLLFQSMCEKHDIPMEYLIKTNKFLSSQIEKTGGLSPYVNKGVDKLAVFPYNSTFSCTLDETCKLLFVLRKISDHTQFRNTVNLVLDSVQEKSSKLRFINRRKKKKKEKENNTPGEDDEGSNIELTKIQEKSNKHIIGIKLFLMYVLSLSRRDVISQDESLQSQFLEMTNYVKEYFIFPNDKNNEDDEEDDKMLYHVLFNSLISLVIHYGSISEDSSDYIRNLCRLQDESTGCMFKKEYKIPEEYISILGSETEREKMLEIHLFASCCFLLSQDTRSHAKKCLGYVFKNQLFDLSFSSGSAEHRSSTNPFLLILLMDVLELYFSYEKKTTSLNNNNKNKNKKKRLFRTNIEVGSLKKKFVCDSEYSSLVVYDEPFCQFLKEGKTDVSVRTIINTQTPRKKRKKKENEEVEEDDENSNFPFLVSLDIHYNSNDIKSRDERNTELFSFDVNLEESNLVLGKETSVKVEMVSKSLVMMNMVYFVLNVPDCFQIDLDSLVELKKSNMVDSYEIFDEANQIQFVFHKFKPKEFKSFDFGVSAKACGIFRKGKCCEMYLFNSPTERFVFDGINNVKINPW